MTRSTTRSPAVAGQFYPADREILKQQLDGFLTQAHLVYPWENRNKHRPKILISPHAGLVFSGPVAAWSYKQLAGLNYQRVVILGASHHALFEQVAIDGHSAWQTPLGAVKLDRRIIKKLLQHNQFEINQKVHQPEHSLEMQLIFLQRVLRSPFLIVPLLVSQLDSKALKTAASILAEILNDPSTLLVISTDLSHYPPYSLANLVDSLTLESILTGSQTEFQTTLSNLAGLKLPVDTFACGHEAIGFGLAIAKELGLSDWRYLRYANSGDVSGQTDSVVGYAALAAYVGKLSYRTEALQLARRSLEFYLRTAKKLIAKAKTQKLNQPGGVFVTLNKNHNLRGCIGTIDSKLPRWKGIIDNAVAAGVNDPRFEAATVEELVQLEVEVSLLTKPKPINHWHQIKLGEDGVVIEFEGRRGVFLPQVGRDYSWQNLEEFLATLCHQKLGASADCFKQKQAQIFTFQAEEIREGLKNSKLKT